MNLCPAGGASELPTGKANSSELPIQDMQDLVIHHLPAVNVYKHYERIRELGQGTYGKVDLVVHRTQGIKLALKFVDKSKTKLKNFLREYTMTRSLRSPFIISVLDVIFETEDSYVFGQEYAPAGDLFDIIPPQVGLPEDVVKRCTQQLGLALDFMHSQDLVHRDVKPENVLLFDRECRRVKLGDLGMVRRVGSRVRRISGTIPYTAPEVCRACQHEGFLVECSQDVWAFGVLVFCMLTGNFPWEAALPSDTFYREFCHWQQGQKRPGLLPSQWRRFTEDALRMFQRLLAADPARRGGVKDTFCFLKYELLRELCHRPSCRRRRPMRGLAVCSSGSGSSSQALPCSLRPTFLRRSLPADLHAVSRSEPSQQPERRRGKAKGQILMATPIEICV